MDRKMIGLRKQWKTHYLLMSACPVVFQIQELQRKMETMLECSFEFQSGSSMTKMRIWNCFEMVPHSRSLIDVLPSLRFLFIHISESDVGFLVVLQFFSMICRSADLFFRIKSETALQANKLAVRTRSDISSFQLLGWDRCSSSVACHCCVD